MNERLIRACSDKQIYNATVGSSDRKRKLAMAKARVSNKSKNSKKAQKKNESEYVVLKLRRDDFELLKAKIREVATETALAQKRMEKTWKEIDKLKAETRKTLAHLDAP
jgi:phosphoribosyl-ATP pyrophosphohydrolase